MLCVVCSGCKLYGFIYVCMFVAPRRCCVVCCVCCGVVCAKCVVCDVRVASVVVWCVMFVCWLCVGVCV